MRITRMLMFLLLAAALALPVAAQDAVPSEVVPYEELPRLGAEDAPVKLLEFADFKCPHCARFANEVVPPIKQEYVANGDVAIYFMNFPVVAEDSVTAGRAAAAVYDMAGQEAFWTFYEAVFDKQGSASQSWATPAFLSSLAASEVSGLDREEMQRRLENDEYMSTVRRDFDIGRELGVRGTPTIFVGDEMLEDYGNMEQLRSLIEARLQ